MTTPARIGAAAAAAGALTALIIRALRRVRASVLTADTVLSAFLGDGYKAYDPLVLAAASPPGYRLAVLKVPFSSKFRITWWLDATGRIGRKRQP